MKVSEFRRFRAEVVGALAAHPEWRKERRSSYDMAATIVPRAAGARTYWRIRNGTKGLSQKYANFEDAAAVCLGSAYDERGDYDIDPQDARLVLKWRREFDALTEGES